MYKPATGRVLWQAMRRYPDIFGAAVERQALKPTGHAMVLDYIDREKPLSMRRAAR